MFSLVKYNNNKEKFAAYLKQNQEDMNRMDKYEVAALGVMIGMDKELTQQLIEQICKKLCKGKMVEVIADEVEEELPLVQKICDLAAQFAPEYDAQKVAEKWFEKNK